MRLPALLLPTLFTTTLLAQASPLNEDLLKLLERSPAVPATIDEAHTRCMNDGVCSPDAVVADFNALYEQKILAMSAGGGTSASQQAMIQKMQDPAFQEEMKKMTPDQLMQLSQQMQGGGLPLSGAPTEAETALAEEWQRLNTDMMDFYAKFNTEWSDLSNAFQKKKDAAESTRSTALKACPIETSAEMSSTNRACCAEVEKKYDGQIRTAAEEWLPKANDLVKRFRSAVEQCYAEGEKRIEAVGYGASCTVQMFYDMVTQIQTAELGAEEAVAAMTGQVWQIGCETRLTIDREMLCP